ncbi:bifunctional phosphopantothenoylcysteine decarboxylase/phosphopantothenate--cysteine ligase CoaBC [SAR202 cluster bacterium AD-802-E10_MRT_200m]|nr:bifunctional phosphopantothenoylcysteine decarboxylase/phosphopantothenate--cysteine ligase CoaBC [SAR202 cluster bacterium AD-802-E10_MRT_200m]
MSNVLSNKKIVLGVTGSIAAYKAADLSSKLVQQGALVDIILTRSATEFITATTFNAITHRPVITGLFTGAGQRNIEHIHLANEADMIVVAPATANVIAKLALGIADDPLTVTALATTAPMVIAPAMDGHMFEHPAVQENIRTLRNRDVHIAGPGQGRMASGLVGIGRLIEPSEILGHIRWKMGQSGDLAGKVIVISAGGTQEPIDPVRIITNRSSGKMGYALAEAARDRGAHVILVSAPTNLPAPIGMTTHNVETVTEMRSFILETCQNADALIMAAAVSDYSPIEAATNKLKKDPNKDSLTLDLLINSDFFNEIPPHVLRIGFAAETENLIANAKKKLVDKGLALIVANDVTKPESGFNVDTNQVTLIHPQGGYEELPLLPKTMVSHKILDRVAVLLTEQDKLDG